mmetsp:Transcript_53816/g.62912  ORF Transcript_53816/g.62912 Transcript_53816/m.62912 type:complete len:250 (-) Transcript_53816:513-1262(-)
MVGREMDIESYRCWTVWFAIRVGMEFLFPESLVFFGLVHLVAISVTVVVVILVPFGSNRDFFLTGPIGINRQTILPVSSNLLPPVTIGYLIFSTISTRFLRLSGHRPFLYRWWSSILIHPLLEMHHAFRIHRHHGLFCLHRIVEGELERIQLQHQHRLGIPVPESHQILFRGIGHQSSQLDQTQRLHALHTHTLHILLQHQFVKSRPGAGIVGLGSVLHIVILRDAQSSDAVGMQMQRQQQIFRWSEGM